jgi:hypothetical protein
MVRVFYPIVDLEEALAGSKPKRPWRTFSPQPAVARLSKKIAKPTMSRLGRSRQPPAAVLVRRR